MSSKLLGLSLVPPGEALACALLPLLPGPSRAVPSRTPPALMGSGFGALWKRWVCVSAVPAHSDVHGCRIWDRRALVAEPALRPATPPRCKPAAPRSARWPWYIWGLGVTCARCPTAPGWAKPPSVHARGWFSSAALGIDAAN